jgi:hypothetical protein
MFQLDVLQKQWLILAIFGGLAVLGMVTLLYLAIWRPRKDPPAGEDGQSLSAWLGSFMPWLLVVLYVGLSAWAVIYVLMQVQTPPNW